MVIRSDFGRKMIEVTDDEIIIYKWFWKRKIKKENIRNAYVSDTLYLTICTYDGRIITCGNGFMLWSDRKKLEMIVDEAEIKDLNCLSVNEADVIKLKTGKYKAIFLANITYPLKHKHFYENIKNNRG